MTLRSDIKTLYHLALRPVRGRDHAERMEDFYAAQAEGYDDFRRRLLAGRENLYRHLADLAPGGVWVDFGGGTGANLEFLGEAIAKFSEVYVVDLARSLLSIVRQRCARHGWKNVEAIEGDATRWSLPSGAADVVTFSYSLTMIPDWFAAIDNAHRILRPNGLFGAVDFYVSRKYPDEGLRRHRWSQRSLWPLWFANDNVFPSPDHLPYLRHRFETVWRAESVNRVPYLPLARVPYYQFVGRKVGTTS